MDEFKGRVKSLDKNGEFGWIEYKPENAEDDEDFDQIYFYRDTPRYELPGAGTEVTFSRERDPDDPDKWIATNVMPKK